MYSMEKLEPLLDEFLDREGWQIGVIHAYNDKTKVLTVKGEDGKLHRAGRDALRTYAYNGGRDAILRFNARWVPIIGFPVIYLQADFGAEFVVPWDTQGLQEVLDAKNTFRQVRVIVDGLIDWEGFGYWVLGQKYPKATHPLSDSFIIETKLEHIPGEGWKALDYDPRGIEVRAQ